MCSPARFRICWWWRCRERREAMHPGTVMSRRKRAILIAVAVAVVVGTAFAVVAVIRCATALAPPLQVYEPAAFATAADAFQGCGIPIPPEAKNIRVAGWSQWIAHEDYVRFEAPVPVCLRHAAVLVPGEALAPVPPDRLAADARPPQPGIFRDLSWFDLGAAQNVVGAGGGSQRPQVWGGQNRGVLYYRLSGA